MNKKTFVWSIIIAVLVSLVLNIFLGRFIAAKISTLPLLNKWKLLAPQAPIVITNREEVRISDNGDFTQIASGAKSKLSTIVLRESGQITVVGNAINVASEGVFVTSAAALNASSSAYTIVLNDGRAAKITSKVIDPATGLVFLKADINNVATAAFGDSQNLSAGDKLLFLANSTYGQSTHFLASYVSVTENDVQHQVFDTDHPTRTFVPESAISLIPGQAVVNTEGDIVGIWSGNTIVPSNFIKNAVDTYVSGSTVITRPLFGFTYSIITKTESSLLGLPQGAAIKNINRTGPAPQAGLLVNDIIISVDGILISESSFLDQQLQSHKPGDILHITVSRAGTMSTLTITAGQLK